MIYPLLMMGIGQVLFPKQAAGRLKVARVARARGLAPETVRNLVVQQTEDRQWGIFGEPRVNVLELNLALDGLRPGPMEN